MEHKAIINSTGTIWVDNLLIQCRYRSGKERVAMITLIAILTFAGALGAAGFVIYATVAPALPKIQAALAGRGAVPIMPSLSPRRVSTLRVTVRPVAQPTYWRAAA